MREEMKLRMVIFFLCFLASCSTLNAGFYLSTIDPKDMKAPLQTESEVKEFLQQVYESSENYTMAAFTRTAIKSDIKKSKTFIHAYYVIHNNDGQFWTVSFNGTAFAPYSQGVWALNTESDITSYKSYLHGKNAWSVDKIMAEESVKAKETISNIIQKLDSHMMYYYKDHVYDKPNYSNCVTALNETHVCGKPQIASKWL
jgi:hypothetical protein